MERIAELIVKHLKSETTPVEEIELQNWVKEKPENREIFDRYNDREQLNDLLIWTDESRSKILENLRVELYPKENVIALRRWTFRRYFYVAASVFFLAIIGVSGYLWWNKKSGTDSVAKTTDAYKNDVPAPIGSQATLVISGNEEINLDKIENGVVTNQGNVEVTKVGDEVVYKVISTGEKVLYHTLKTDKGGFIKIQLPDASFVWLNAMSSVTYPTRFEDKTREVNISGEVFFEVAKDKKKPFIVKAGEMSVEVTGTAFAISAYDDEPVIRTTLVEGSVRVVKGNNEKNLIAGQQADVVNNSGGEINVVEEGNFDEAIAFKENRFDFQDTHIENIMKQVKRWYGVEVEFQTKMDRYFNALLSRKESLSKLLRWLELTERVHFKIEGNKVLVLP